MVDRVAREERRLNSRIEKINLVQVNRFDEEGFRADMSTGRTLDLSRGGMRLELHHPLPLRSEVELDVVAEEVILKLQGVVVYLEALDGETCRMGISFRNLSPQVQRELDQVLAN